MLSSVDLLHQRLDLLERTYVGGQVDPKWSGDLLQRIDTLSARYTCLQDETPVFRACYESVMKVKPLILERKASLTVLTQQLEGLLASKETLQARIETVLAVGDLAATLYSDDLKGNVRWEVRLLNRHQYHPMFYCRCGQMVTTIRGIERLTAASEGTSKGTNTRSR